ncbi:MAG: TolC family protein [Fibrella sp.]|nr:TolC family protein [Armatimonadota bacterium]
MTAKKLFRQGNLLPVAAYSLVAICLGTAHAQAQDPLPTPAPQGPPIPPENLSTTPPNETRKEGPNFPKNEQKERSPSNRVPAPEPGNNRVTNSPQQLTLESAIALALRLQPTVSQAQASREASEQRLKAQQADYYPQVQPSYTYNNRLTTGSVTQFVGGVPVVVSTGRTTENKQFNAIASYTVFDSFNRELSNKQARQSLRGAKFSEEDTRQRVIADVANNYFNSLRTAALVTVSQSQVARAENTLAVVEAQVEAGVSPRKDTFQARADLLNAQVSLLQAQNNAAIAQAQLKQSIGLVGGEQLTIADVPAPTASTPVTVLNAPTPTTTSDIETVNTLSETAYQTRPDIARSQQDLEVNQTGVGLARINDGLQANLTVSDGYQFTPVGNNTYPNSQNRQVNLNLSYPLFNGGLTRAQVRQAQANARGTEANLIQLRQSVGVEVEQAWRTLTQARAAIPAAQAAQEAAQINYDAAVESRREGVGSIVEVIQAQTQLVQAQTQLVQTTYDFYSADARLARAVGFADRIAGIGRVANATAPAGTPAAGDSLTPPPGGTPTTPPPTGPVVTPPSTP